MCQKNNNFRCDDENYRTNSLLMTSRVDRRNMSLAVCELQENVQPEEAGDSGSLYLCGGDNTISDIWRTTTAIISHAPPVFFCS